MLPADDPDRQQDLPEHMTQTPAVTGPLLHAYHVPGKLAQMRESCYTVRQEAKDL